MALPSYGGGMGRVYLCVAITVSPFSADMGSFFPHNFVWVCVGETDDSTECPVAQRRTACGWSPRILIPTNFA